MYWEYNLSITLTTLVNTQEIREKNDFEAMGTPFEACPSSTTKHQCHIFGDIIYAVHIKNVCTPLNGEASVAYFHMWDRA